MHIGFIGIVVFPVIVYSLNKNKHNQMLFLNE